MAAVRWIVAVLLLLITATVAISDEEIDPIVTGSREAGEVGLVDEGVEDDAVGPAIGVDTVYMFPKNPGRSIPAGETKEILVGISNNGDSPLKINSIRASLHLPFDHKLLVQNLTAQEFVNATVPPHVQATFAYPFTVSKFLQPGSLGLEAAVMYEVDEDVHKSIFYNGTIEIVEPSGFFSGETLFLVTLGLGLLGLLGMWLHGQVQRFSKTRRTKAVETGTRSTDANSDWLQGTAFTLKASKSIAQPTKSKKKK